MLSMGEEKRKRGIELRVATPDPWSLCHGWTREVC